MQFCVGRLHWAYRVRICLVCDSSKFFILLHECCVEYCIVHSQYRSWFNPTWCLHCLSEWRIWAGDTCLWLKLPMLIIANHASYAAFIKKLVWHSPDKDSGAWRPQIKSKCSAENSRIQLWWWKAVHDIHNVEGGEHHEWNWRLTKGKDWRRGKTPDQTDTYPTGISFLQPSRVKSLSRGEWSKKRYWKIV